MRRGGGSALRQRKREEVAEEPEVQLDFSPVLEPETEIVPEPIPARTSYRTS